jgi:ClpP class serine protease
LEVKVVKAGRYKGTGIPGTQVTEEQLAQLQSRVDGLYKNFVATVTAGRGAVEMDTMQGQDFYCVDAVARRLVDSIGTLNQAIADVKYLAMKGKKQ